MSPRPSLLPVIADNIPVALRAHRKFVGWILVERDGRWTKVPMCATDAINASVTDPATWAEFDEALAAYEAVPLDGIGFVLTADDPFTGIDLDHCRNAETGVIEPWAQTIIDRFKSYTEISPSGTGIRIFIKGTLPAGGRRKGSIEIYNTGRFLSITGQVVPGALITIEAKQAELDAFHKEVFGEASNGTTGSSSTSDGPGNALTDADLLRRARQAANGKWFARLFDFGDWQGEGYASQSEADFALCSSLAWWTARDTVQVDRLFRGSRLMRPKWDEKRNGSTYGADTIAKAIAGVTGGYTTGSASAEQEPEVDDDAPRLLTIGEVLDRVGAKDGWVVDKMLAVADMSLFAAQPYTGKSTFGGALTSAVSRGEDFLGRKTKQGLVIYLAFEGAKTVAKHLRALGHASDDPNILMWIADGNPKDPITWLRATVGDRRPVLIIADTLTDFSSISHGASNSGYEETYGKLGPVYRWAQERKTHMLLFHHASTKRDLDGLDAVLGSTGIVGKPGTVLLYKRLNPKDQKSPRVLSCRKHREAEVDAQTDIPSTVLDFNPATKALTVAGLAEEVGIREIGVAMISAILQAGAGRLQTWKDLMDAVAARKEDKLEALRLLTNLATGVLTEHGKAKSRSDGLRYTIRAGLQGNPITLWRSTFRLGSQNASWFPDAGNQVADAQSATKSDRSDNASDLVPGYRDDDGNQDREKSPREEPPSRVGTRLGSRVRKEVDGPALAARAKAMRERGPRR